MCASDLLRMIGEEAFKELEPRSLLPDPRAVMGVQSIDMNHFQVRLVARTLPGRQFDVGRMLGVMPRSWKRFCMLMRRVS
jgi:moderate conductance mechanosensitive channel